MTLVRVTLRLKWERHEDRSKDFIAKDGDTPVGRIYHTSNGTEIGTYWFWSCYGRHDRAASGMVATKDEAARAVEGAWFGGLKSIP